MTFAPVWLWVAGVVVLGACLFYGVMRNRNRSAQEKQVTQAATKDLYKEEDRSA